MNSHNPGLGSNQNQWNEGLASTHLESKDMSPLPPHESNTVHSQRVARSFTGNSYDEAVSSRMFPNAQVSFHMSSAKSENITRSISPENLAMRVPSQQMDLSEFDFPYHPGDDAAGTHHIVQGTSNAEPYSANVSLAGPSYNSFPAAGDEAFTFPVGSNTMASQVPVSHESIYDPSIIDSSMLFDGAEFQDSRGSPPILPEESWNLPAHSLVTSPTHSPLTNSPPLEGLSPRYIPDYPDLTELPPYEAGDRVTRKANGPRQSKVASDIAAHSRQQRLLGPEASDESFRLVGRSALEIDNTARDHPLYHNVSAGADGLYHCPWEGQASCQHKAEKLKCNYEYDDFKYPHPQCAC